MHMNNCPGNSRVFMLRRFIIGLVFIFTLAESDAQPYTVLRAFQGQDGSFPYAGMVEAGGILYGTTYSGGASGQGTLFKLGKDGTGFDVLTHFGYDADGRRPYSNLAVGGNGSLYGTTCFGGTNGFGTVFKINPDGSGYVVLKEFTGTNGIYPCGRLVVDGGMLYGATSFGGDFGYGTVFRLATNGGSFGVLHSFNEDGRKPYSGLLLEGGTLYGTTQESSSGSGTIFKINTNGSGYTLLKTFNGTDGAILSSGLTLEAGMLYGITSSGGTNNHGTIFGIHPDGTGFATLKKFGGPDGSHPSSALVANGGALYGTTVEGGSHGKGTVFKINLDGSGFKVLKDFTGQDGANAYGDLLLSGGVLYGTTIAGSNSASGLVFSLDLRSPLAIQPLGNAAVLTWTNPAFGLQSAASISGAFSNVAGATSPHTNAPAAGQQFFRLRQ
jgi:uncharacterized repeat protein (TIGR03803 family)